MAKSVFKIKPKTNEERFLKALDNVDIKTGDLFNRQLSHSTTIRLWNVWHTYLKLVEKFGHEPFKWTDYRKVSGVSYSACTSRLRNLQSALVIKRVAPKDKFLNQDLEEFIYGGGTFIMLKKSDEEIICDMVQNA
jgi:hypothetical protein